MKTIDIELAMMRKLDFRVNLMVTNVSWGVPGLHECDLLVLSGSNYATEIEIKISKADIKQDKEKWHNHNSKWIARLYFAVPEELKDFALKHIPERAGLFVVCKNVRGYLYVDQKVKEAKRNTDAVKWTDKQRYNLARLGAMRIYGLKKKLKNHENKNK